MRQYGKILFAAGLLALPAAAVAAEDANPTQVRPGDVKETLRQWVQVSQQVAREKAAWQFEREILAATRETLQAEILQLESRKAAATQDLRKVDDENGARLATRDQKAEVLRRLALRTTELESRVLELEPALPSFLREELAAEFRSMRTHGVELVNDASGKPAKVESPVTRRLQSLFVAIIKIEKFNGLVKSASEFRKLPDGSEIQVDTLYWGLGAAFSVDAARKHAFVGHASASGWTWTHAPESLERIIQLHKIFGNSATAAFVPLPVEIH